LNSKDLVKLIESEGWQLMATKGSHHQFTHPSKLGKVTIPHPKKDLAIGLVRNILKQAGIDPASLKKG